jgi:type VI secretion system protein VasJ
MSETKDRIVTQAESYATPVTADSPSGSDISYDVEFESVKSQIDKLTSMSGGQPSWRDVVEISDKILTTKSKDLRLLAWSAIGRFNMQGVEGFALGVAIAARVASVHWDTMFPPARRAKARANLFEWMNDQALGLLGAVEPSLGNGDAIRALQELYEDLDALLSEKLGDAYSGLGGMRSLLRDKVRSIPEAVVEAPPPPDVPTTGSTAAARGTDQTSRESSGASSIDIPTITSADDVVPALRTLGKSIVDAARQLRKADPANAWAYQLHRNGLWLAVKAPPPAEGGRTRIAPPPADVRKKIEAKVTGEQWLDLLASAEDLSGQNLFWFDLHRFVALAMDRLGALFVDARSAVGREVVAFLQKFPALVSLAYNDGTPFADPGTQMWLDDERSKHGQGGGGGGGSTKATEEDEEVARRFAEAKEMVGGGKVVEGLGLASQLAGRAADARLRFRGRLTVGELALQGGKPEIGRPILEQLVSEIQSRKLEDWEPSLLASALSSLLACHRALGSDFDKSEIRQLCDQLCQLDPAAAIKWSGS